jgi:hypothetical protein
VFQGGWRAFESSHSKGAHTTYRYCISAEAGRSPFRFRNWNHMHVCGCFNIMVIILRVERISEISTGATYPTLKTVGHWHCSIVDVERVGDEHDHVGQLIENSLVGLMVMARPAHA